MSKFNKHIIIVGSARSGTSWLCELLAKPYRYRLLFEPEHEFNTKEGHLLCDRWISDAQEAGKGHNYLKRVFLNRIDNNWIAQLSNRKWKRHLWPLIPKRFIIKFVRCNLAANYINKTFKIPVIHIIRNPFDVIESQQRVRFPWLYDLSRFEKQKKLVTLVKEKYNFNLTNTVLLSDVEKLAVRWCLENIVTLDIYKNRNTNYKVVKFEALRNDKQIYMNICKEFNLQTLPDIDAVYENPSSKSHSRGLKGNKPQKISLNQEELESISAILQTFNLDFYPINKKK